MNCKEAWRLLNAHADGEREFSRELGDHLAGCARCRASLAALQALRGALRRSCEPEPVPRSLLAGVGEHARRDRGRRAGLRAPFALAAPGIAALALALWLALGGSAREPMSPSAPRAVYHLSSSESASAALRSLGNHLQASPGIRVVVVAHGGGVDFLLRGARDDSGRLYEEAVRQFVARGVEFRICANTLERRRVTPSEVIEVVALVPSGIAEIERLQRSGRYAYLRL